MRGFLSLLVCLFGLASLSMAIPPDPKYKLVLQIPPATGVDSAVVSPDGSTVATATGEGGVRLYDAKSGTLLRVLGGVGDRNVVFSPDGKMLTAAGFHMDKLVGLWDVQSGKRVRTFVGQTEWEADATAISPDGKLLASTGTDKQILVWEIATGKLHLQLKDQPFRTSALKFSPDSTMLAAGGGDKAVRIWDSATGQLRHTLKGQSDWICTIAFSSDGKQIASGSCDWGSHRGHDWPRAPYRGTEQCEWRLWDVASGKILQRISTRGQLLSLDLAPDGKSLACGIDKEVILFGLAPAAQGRVIASHERGVTSVAFSPDGTAILSTSHDQTVKCTTVATGEMRWHATGAYETVNTVALSKDASLLVTGSSDWRFARSWMGVGAKGMGPGAVRLWDAHTGRMLRRLGDPAEQVMAAAISPDGQSVAAGGGIAGGKGAVDVWDTSSGKALWTARDHEKEVLALAFAADGSALATADAVGVVKVRDAKTGAVKQTLADHNGGAAAVAFSPDGNTLFCGQARGGTRVWDVRTGKLLKTLHVADSQAASFTVDRLTESIGLSADGGTLATCASSVNGEYVDPVRIWDARSGALRREFSAEGIHGQPMALSPDGSIVATGGKSVQLWDANTGKPLRQLNGDLKRTQSIVFSSDGKLVVEGGSYGTTNIWETASGRLLVTLYAFCDARTGSLTDDWLAYCPEGYYHGSPGVDRYLGWRVGEEFQTPETLGGELHRPERVAAELKIGR